MNASSKMRALTLWPEQAFAVAYLGKDRENRKQRPPRTIVGQWLAIHAGAHIGGRPSKGAARLGMCAMFEVAELSIGSLPDQDLMVSKLVRSAVVAVVKIGHAYEIGNPRRWYLGDPWMGWRIDECVTLREPVPCKGYQGIWFLSDDVAAQISAQLPGGAP